MLTYRSALHVAAQIHCLMRSYAYTINDKFMQAFARTSQKFSFISTAAEKYYHIHTPLYPNFPGFLNDPCFLFKAWAGMDV